MFCLFASPPERDLEWSDEGVEGSWRFLNRVWRMVFENREALSRAEPHSSGFSLTPHLRDMYGKTHQTIKKVTEDIEERFHFNTAISAIMELFNTINQFLNTAQKISPAAWSVIREAVDAMVILMHPIVPHITEELWTALGHGESLVTISWPTYTEKALEKETRLVVVQVNGKVRSRIEIPVSYDDQQIQDQALGDERVRRFIDDKAIKRVIVVQKKLVNVVI
jgi:leucyl-tRNA synthetase